MWRVIGILSWIIVVTTTLLWFLALVFKETD